ncbi:MAG: DUF2905 domain-containing protein [Simkania sp.]|uniref:DUF2905 domain-containing protein n=1 Tax=Simkania negevensis (strain ATCC VR-1471 / DSM 27360 / Z) TaxID=331113 RepID=F8L417_SIMNZ|nr:DUF2905 domain-containing protein [Simkania sp.]MCB1074952.1 DUF2905 domain-containing protein [Simkania sp.]MCB1083648.1 DUF2905 domain-containing protein [Simkania sp.]MCP5489757.1 DUF2905 domain-containing protein [Chlamydiales bacterium]CCB90047.1 hypothetical protein SNE_A21700 [Simkania negevensis Z]
MGRLIILVGLCLIILGVLITLKVPLNWIGHLPGDCSFQWGSTKIYIPITTSILFSLILSIFLFLFSRR